MIHVATPERLQHRLACAADGPRDVVHRGRDAIYVDLDGACLGLISARATRVPCAMWTRLDDLSTLVGPVLVRSGALVVGAEQVRVGRLVDVGVPHLPAAAFVWRHEEWSSTRPPEMTPAHVDTLIGSGPGLTPYGDDVLAGWLVTRAAAGRPDPQVSARVRARMHATTLLSATLLECAIRGEAVPQMRRWLAAAGTADEGPATAELLRVGASSGAGMLAGARLALRSLAVPTDHLPDHLRRTA